MGPWWSSGKSVQFPAMNDRKKTKAQLIEELDGLLGEAVVEQALERVRLPALSVTVPCTRAVGYVRANSAR